MTSRNWSTFARACAAAGVVVLALAGCAADGEEAADGADATTTAPGGEASMDAELLESSSADGQFTALDIDELAGVVRIATAAGVREAPLPTEEGETVGGTDLLGERVAEVKSYERLGTRILVSGHPADDEADDAHLGLWEIDTESGEWQPLAFEGDVDFHAIASAGATPADGVLAAADSVTGSIYYSPDGGLSWQTAASLDASALAFTADASTLFAVTPDGLQASADRGQTFAPVEGAPELVMLATPPVGTSEWRIVGVTQSGELWRTIDGVEWQPIGALTIEPSAIALGKSPDAVYAVTPESVVVTTDGGQTLTVLVTLNN
ncbi:MAG TPA: hypothetical protein VFM95_02900 [Microcella sp.]|nr:hypothetical protein [Microcella sp.]